MLWDNDRKMNRLVAKLLRVIIYIILGIIVASAYSIFNVSIGKLHRILTCVIFFFILPTVIVNGFKQSGTWVRYMINICTIIGTAILLGNFMKECTLLVFLPISLSSLYFDKQLSKFSFILSGITFITSFIYYFTMGSGDTVQFTDYLQSENMMSLLVIGGTFIIVAFLQISLANRSAQLFKTAFSNSNALMRNRDGLDVIVDNTDILFRARNYAEIASIMLFLVRTLLKTIEGSTCDLRGYIAVLEERERYLGINQNMEPIQFMPGPQEVHIDLEGEEYDIPIDEDNDSNTVFINKNKLFMHFYVEGRLFAFMIFHIHLADTDEVLNKLVRVLYRNIHLAINNIKLTHDMYETQEEIVRAFSEISESKSGQTGRHIKRVSEYMKIMAEAIDLEQNEKDSLVIASMMHDIGKLLIPESILEKPGKLTAAEFDIMKTHVKLGYKLLEFSPGRIMEIARVIALQHHEKWDGTGYLGMKGEEIDYYSRIMAVVDVFDALMSKRSYKESWKIEDAYNEILSQSGKHFDPSVVRLFQEHFDKFIEVLQTYPDYEKTA